MRLVRHILLLLGCAASLQCSLLAPDDRYFLGSGGGGGGAEVVCKAAPACDAATSDGPIVDVTVDDAVALPGMVANAEPDTTFSLGPGDYALSAVISIKVPGITLRSSSGFASDVVLDSSAPVAIEISADDATLQGLTLRGGSESAVLLSGGKDVIIERPRLCNVAIADGGKSFVLSTAEGGWVDCGRIEASSFTLSDAGRASQCPADGLVSAVSVAGGRGWVVTESDFSDFFCADPLPVVDPAACTPKAVGLSFNLGSRDTLIERSRFFGMSRAIVLGYTTTPTPPRAYADHPYDDGAIDHFDGILRNNLIVGHPLCFDTGIELNHAREPTLAHNTVVYLDLIEFAAIDRRYPETKATLINNLVRGPITFRDEAPEQTDVGTVAPDALTDFFVDPSADDAGDYHLVAGASAAIDQGVPSDLAGLDLDGQPHSAGRGPDVGAYEYTP